MESFEYLVVGAGPGGLAFASTIHHDNTLVVELGKPALERDRLNPQDCVQGAGGAGLFSDGKFSFYPAGSVLWTSGAPLLQSAYHRLQKSLGFSLPPFPEITSLAHPPEGVFHLKAYPSFYVSLEERLALIEALTSQCRQIRYHTEFQDTLPLHEGYRVRLWDHANHRPYEVFARHIVLAGGRFMPLFFRGPKRFRRFEFGFRIAGPSSLIRKGTALLDPKYLLRQGDVEWRTFCWCEEGEVVQTAFKGLVTHSGRADCPPTRWSNFGFNIRVKDPSLLSISEQNRLLKLAPYEMSLKTFHKEHPALYPQAASSLIRRGLASLAATFPFLHEDGVRVVGPTLEGVGHYPDQLPSGIHAVGDAGGLYRGIVPGLLSGYLLALNENQQRNSSMNKATILNHIDDEEAYKSTYPPMKGVDRSVGATQEVHIFLSELNPTEERLQDYYDAVEEWNALHPELTYAMKPCYLALVFRHPEEGEKTVAVMQSSRYIRSNDTDRVVRESHQDAEWFTSKGFSVIREKIEAQAHGIEGIPQTDEEMALYPSKYFEFHIKVGRVDREDHHDLSEEEIAELKAISRRFTRQFGVPVPLSYNLNRDQITGDRLGHQRFLNVRFRDIGLQTIVPKLDEIQDAIVATGRFRVLKTISEYVWYDTFTQLDHGWIDYTPTELDAIVTQLQQECLV